MRKRPEYNKKLIGRNLRRCRRTKHISVEQVREYLRLGTVQAIYKWEEGTSYPQTDNMLALMELYGIEIKDLLYEESLEEGQGVNGKSREAGLEQQFFGGRNKSHPLYLSYRLASHIALDMIGTKEFYGDSPVRPDYDSADRMYVYTMEIDAFHNDAERYMSYVAYFSGSAA